MRLPGAGTLLAAAALSLCAAAARGSGVEFRSVQVAGKGVADPARTVNVKLAGSFLDPASFDPAAALTLQVGDFVQTLPAGTLEVHGSKASYRAPAGAAGLRSLSVSTRSGKFAAALEEVKCGDLSVPVAVSVLAGRPGLSVRLPLAAKGAKARWSAGQEMLATIGGRVLDVRSEEGRALLRPMTGATFVRNDQEEQEINALQRGSTDPDGNFSVEVSFTDPTALDRLDLSRVLGDRAGSTRMGRATATVGLDGTMQAAAVVQSSSGVAATVTASAPVELAVSRGDGLRSGTLSIPAGAVEETVARLEFTPLTMPAEMPAPAPEGWVAIAAAELRASSPKGKAPAMKSGVRDLAAVAGPVVFLPEAAPTVVLERPDWASAEVLGSSEILLCQFVGGRWIPVPGHGKYDPATDTIGPDPADPARLDEAAPLAYVVAAPAGLPASFGGTVTAPEGGGVAGAVVLTPAGAAVTDDAGGFEVPGAAVVDTDLEVIQAIAGGASAARVVERGEAGSIAVPVEDDSGLEWKLGLVSGVAWMADGRIAVPGAKVSVRLADAVRGLRLDAHGTPGNFADDEFLLDGLDRFGVESVQWRLLLPGDDSEFVSALSTGFRASPVDLVLEAQDAGRTVAAGAYTVRALFAVPRIGTFAVQAGFRAEFSALSIEIRDIRMPAAYEGAPAVEVAADSTGRYAAFFRAPEGLPLEARAEKAGVVSQWKPFTHEATVAMDHFLAGWYFTLGNPGEFYGAGIAVLGSRVFVDSAGGPGNLWAYDPPSDVWTPLAPRPAAVNTMGLVALDGLVYAVGGGYSTNVDVYDPAADSWTSRAPLPWGMSPATVAISGRIYAVGYTHATNSIVTIEYDPIQDSWTRMEDFPRSGGQSTLEVMGGVLGGKIYLVESSSPQMTMAVFDPVTNVWALKTPPPTARMGISGTVFQGRLYILGGGDFAYTKSFQTVEVYDADTDSWSEGTPAPGNRWAASCFEYEGMLHVLGGGGPGLAGWVFRP